jgi:hypothetical protein
VLLSIAFRTQIGHFQSLTVCKDSPVSIFASFLSFPLFTLHFTLSTTCFAADMPLRRTARLPLRLVNSNIQPRRQGRPPFAPIEANFKPALSQPSSLTYCTGCKTYKTSDKFTCNRTGAPYQPCVGCSAVSFSCFSVAISAYDSIGSSKQSEAPTIPLYCVSSLRVSRFFPCRLSITAPVSYTTTICSFLAAVGTGR